MCIRDRAHAIDYKNKHFEEMSNKKFEELETGGYLQNVTLYMDFDGMEDLKKWKNKFDLVVFNMALPVSSTLVRGRKPEMDFLEEAIRVSKSDGIIAMSYYEIDFLDPLFDIFEEAFNKHKRYFWRSIAQLLTFDELKKQLTSRKLRVRSYPVDIEDDSIKNAEEFFEFLLCSQMAIDFSFVRCPDAVRDNLRTDLIQKLDEKFRSPLIFPINLVIASKT